MANTQLQHGNGMQNHWCWIFHTDNGRGSRACGEEAIPAQFAGAWASVGRVVQNGRRRVTHFPSKF
jgi:hypothetical protein